MKRSLAVVHPYWDFWEQSVPGDFRSDREELLRSVTAALADEFTVVASLLLSNPDQAANAADDCRSADAVLVLSTMAVPAATSMAVSTLATAPSCPSASERGTSVLPAPQGTAWLCGRDSSSVDAGSDSAPWSRLHLEVPCLAPASATDATPPRRPRACGAVPDRQADSRE